MLTNMDKQATFDYLNQLDKFGKINLFHLEFGKSLPNVQEARAFHWFDPLNPETTQLLERIHISSTQPPGVSHHIVCTHKQGVRLDAIVTMCSNMGHSNFEDIFRFLEWLKDAEDIRRNGKQCFYVLDPLDNSTKVITASYGWGVFGIRILDHTERKYSFSATLRSVFPFYPKKSSE